MSNTPELRFQGLCLINSEGYLHMDCYDEFPEQVRDRLKSSTYNLCAACVYEQAIRDKQDSRYDLQVPRYLSVICSMEAELRSQEGIGGHSMQQGAEA